MRLSNNSTKKMTIAATPSIKDGSVLVGGKVISTNPPENVIVTPVDQRSAYIGATSSSPSSRHVFSLGILEEYKFMCLFRSKIWWMIPRVGKSGSEIPIETQMLLLEVKEKSAINKENDEISGHQNCENATTLYILLLPVLDGPFRSSLQGNSDNELQFCVESGDANVQTSQALEGVFINSGDNPFELIKSSIKILEKHKGTFSHIENKKIPAYLDWFGWCTWDAFYHTVNPQGIIEGLQSFVDGGCKPKFLIIDDGWQETVNEYRKEGELLVEGAQFASRLVDIKENNKFKSSGSNNTFTNLHNYVDFIKDKYGLKYVYVWHALAGYWGGVHPLSESMKKYNPKISFPIQSPGNVGNLRDIAMDSLEKYGVGIIDPERIFEFYDDLHSYLATCNVDGVKVDVQNVLETLGSGFGGRVALTRRYKEALEQSVAQNFEDNNLICCMSHNNDTIYSSKKSAVSRASEDFMPREPTFQTLHVATVAFNSLLLGEIVVPDWDMFHSQHETAQFHAAARAIGGCAVYVSDKPGNHNFEILRKLVLPNGSILRARHAGRPTRDSLFQDPIMDGKSLLKIWNLNKLTGVLGIFNCQGAGSWPLSKGDSSVPKTSHISGHLSPLDVESLEELAGENWSGEYAIYAFNSGSLSKLLKKGTIEVSLKTLECEIYTISPIKVFGHDLLFAPIGLLDMYNSGGAVDSLSCTMDFSQCTITVRGFGVGRFGVYSSSEPTLCLVNKDKINFSYNIGMGLLIVKLDGECNLKEIEFVYCSGTF